MEVKIVTVSSAGWVHGPSDSKHGFVLWYRVFGDYIVFLVTIYYIVVFPCCSKELLIRYLSSAANKTMSFQCGGWQLETCGMHCCMAAHRTSLPLWIQRHGWLWSKLENEYNLVEQCCWKTSLLVGCISVCWRQIQFIKTKAAEADRSAIHRCACGDTGWFLKLCFRVLAACCSSCATTLLPVPMLY